MILLIIILLASLGLSLYEMQRNGWKWPGFVSYSTVNALFWVGSILLRIVT